jgi:hypothetical protein
MQYLTVDDGMYVDFQTDQKHYLEDLVPKYGDINEHTQVPPWVWLEFRFRHVDPASGAEAYDNFGLTVFSSGETAAALCGFEDVMIEQGTEFYHPRQYTVGSNTDSTKYDGWSKEILIDNVLEYPAGFEDECKEQIYRTLAMKFGGEFYTVWNEHRKDEADEHVFLKTDGDLAWLVISITHEMFMTELQPEFETDASTIDMEF